MRYVIIKPVGYEKKPFPGLNKWIPLMRSGKYEQGIGCLATGYEQCGEPMTYCCLGLLSLSQGRLTTEKRDGTSVDCSASELSSDNPLVVALVADGPISFPNGISVEKLTMSPMTTAHSFVGLNDDLALNFNEIADIADELYYDTQQPTKQQP
jgi:hypothetical protein